ncbi:MAG: hypothetical protein ACMUIP_04775 [bacterium]
MNSNDLAYSIQRCQEIIRFCKFRLVDRIEKETGGIAALSPILKGSPVLFAKNSQ